MQLLFLYFSWERYENWIHIRTRGGLGEPLKALPADPRHKEGKEKENRNFSCTYATIKKWPII